MTKLFMVIFLLIPSAYGANKSDIILESLFSQIGVTPASPQNELEGTPTPNAGPQISKGQQYVQEALKKNREALKQRAAEKEVESERPKTLADESRETLLKWKQQVQDTQDSWRQEVKATHALWRQKQEEFYRQLPTYKKNLIKIESDEPPVSSKELKKPVQKKITVQYHVIPGALDVPMKDQGDRPTCSAFAGIRGVETLLSKSGRWKDLSEQYLYWLSKPNCQTSPCADRGSWVGLGLKAGIQSSSPDIPLSVDCPYNSAAIPSNETQLPLKEGCKRGVVKVEDLESLATLDEVVEALDKNYPVLTGFYLTPNFYKTAGLVTDADSTKAGEIDSHATGHTLILLGWIKLPESMVKTEGKICFLVANSWGEGWGQGGFGCLTERWAQHYRGKNPFLALTGIKTN
jgi:C1A family cysteine protease